jgi:hypothetical protein
MTFSLDQGGKSLSAFSNVRQMCSSILNLNDQLHGIQDNGGKLNGFDSLSPVAPLLARFRRRKSNYCDDNPCRFFKIGNKMTWAFHLIGRLSSFFGATHDNGSNCMTIRQQGCANVLDQNVINN